MLPEQQSRLQLVRDVEEYLSDISAGLASQETRNFQLCGPQWPNLFDNAIANFDSSLQRLLGVLRRERNASLKIVNLPDEIICEIFSYLGLFGVIQSSQVCHRWRHVALTQPRLWTSIELVTWKIQPVLFSMQIERSGTSPVHLTFGGQDHLIPLRAILQDLLARSRSITQLETRFCDDAGISSSFTMSLLESMHITVNSEAGMQSLKWMKNCPRLRYLSFTPLWIASSEVLLYARNLHTLHLTDAKEHPDAILFVLSKLPVLKELRLDKVSENTLQRRRDRDAIIAADTFPKLQILSIAYCTADFVAKVLIPPLVSPDTNLHITMTTNETRSLALNCHREEMESSLWIYNSQSSFLFSHETSLTKIDLGTIYNVEPISQIPVFIDCNSIVSLALMEECLTSSELILFPSLIRLAFASILGEEKNSLTNVLNPDLILSCPNLNFIGLILRGYQQSWMEYDDDTGLVIESFLETWIEIHGKVFGTLRVQDEVDPSRWEAHAPLLEMILENFELGEAMANEEKPIFPETRDFT
ncbi:hypothetical protein CPB86DRAFT_826893 [Serendipita vermifera]|nr:hypothetical protein CPB86DRAFT_826893 [Serendipita vermifera]